MKGTLKWLRDYILPGVLLLWLGGISFDGVLSEAVRSWQSFVQWINEPLMIARWSLLMVFLLTAAYGAGLIYSLISSRRNSSDMNELVTQLTDVLGNAAKELETSDTSIGKPDGRMTEAIALAVEMVQLNANQTLVLRLLGDHYAEDGHGNVSSLEISQVADLTLLRTEQVLDQLQDLGLVKDALVIGIKRLYSLSSIGREWLLAHGYA